MINIQEIVIINTAGVLLLVLLLFTRLEITKNKHFSDDLFDKMIAITLGAQVAETLTFIIDGKPGAIVHFLQYLLNGYLFIASCGVGLLWVFYVDFRIYHSIKRIAKRALFLAIPFFVVAILVVCDFFGAGFIFSITEQNVYVRGQYVLISYVVLFYEYISSFVISIRAVRRNNHVKLFPILHFIIPIVVGTVVQGMFYGLSVGWFCVGLAFVFIQMQLSNQNACVDDLSALYNRKYYYYFMNRLTENKKIESVSGIMIDVNHFKSINDQYGHKTGDDAIRVLGHLISTVITEKDMAFRISGDEFIIISVGVEETDVKHLIATLKQKLEEFNAGAYKPYKLSLAIGYTICKLNEMDSDDFLHKMDMKMYEEKNKYYQTAGVDRRAKTRNV